MEHASDAYDVCFDFDADADFCTSSWLFWSWEERGQVSNFRFSYYISLVFLSTGTGRLGLLNQVGWSRCCASTPRIASAVPQGSGSSCAMQVAQDYVCKMLCGSLSSPACGLLGKLFTLSCCYFGLWSSQEAFPEKAEGERSTLGDGSDGKCFQWACPPALQQPLEWWKLPDQWKNWLGYRLQGEEMSATFFYISSSPQSYLGRWPKIVSPKTCCSCNWWGVSLVFIFL